MLRSKVIKSVVLTLVLSIVVLVVSAPFFWMVAISFMKTGESSALPLRFLPEQLTLEQYETLFQRLNFMRNFLNSLLVAIFITVASLLVNSLAGFGFAKYRFKGRGALFTALLATMVIPGQVTMLPVFLLLRELGMLNSYWGLVIPGTASVFSIFFFRQYMKSIPDDLIDSARIDGCSDFRIYWQIILPLARPALVTLGLFTFLGSWNDFLWPLIVMN
ncbi:MAG: carbohydrate ABC transporter permease, partial [Candidatus Kryptoniota bacterium]